MIERNLYNQHGRYERWGLQEPVATIYSFRLKMDGGFVSTQLGLALAIL